MCVYGLFFFKKKWQIHVNKPCSGKNKIVAKPW